MSELIDLTQDDINKEVWKPVTEETFSDIYEISDMGRLRNIKTNKIIAPCKTSKYLIYRMQNKANVGRYMAHRLVACAFVDDPEDSDENNIVNHKDGNKFNNKASNLEWTTSSKNAIHSRQVLKQKKTLKTVICTDINGDEFIYEGVKNAAIATGVGHTRLKQCLSGKRTDTDGLKWRYQNSEHDFSTDSTENMTPIEGFPGYFINEEGKIYGVTKRRYLKHNMSEEYPKVILYKNAKPHCFYVHVLVAKTFIPNPKNKTVVNHIDENKSNCHVSNLEWVSHSENSKKHFQMKRNLSVRNVQSQDVHGDGENSSVAVQSDNE